MYFFILVAISDVNNKTLFTSYSFILCLEQLKLLCTKGHNLYLILLTLIY